MTLSIFPYHAILSKNQGIKMKNILLITALITGVAYADKCDDYKRKAAKYEQMSMSAANLDMGAKYMKMAIDNKKQSMNACFISGHDKEKMYSDIKDMEEMRIDMKREAAKIRKHEKDVAKASSGDRDKRY